MSAESFYRESLQRPSISKELLREEKHLPAKETMWQVNGTGAHLLIKSYCLKRDTSPLYNTRQATQHLLHATQGHCKAFAQHLFAQCRIAVLCTPNLSSMIASVSRNCRAAYILNQGAQAIIGCLLVIDWYADAVGCILVSAGTLLVSDWSCLLAFLWMRLLTLSS